MIDPADRADAGAFLVRLRRLDPQAVVRLRPGPGRSELWAMLPFKVLVVRTLSHTVTTDTTVAAADLLGPDPLRRDAAWRWDLR